MLTPITTREKRRGWRSLLAGVLCGMIFAAVSGGRMYASAGHAPAVRLTLAAMPACSASGGGWQCYLPPVLRLLEVIAVVLGGVLLVVVALAVKSYRKNKEDEKVGP